VQIARRIIIVFMALSSKGIAQAQNHPFRFTRATESEQYGVL
jgi:hypothetical protein